MTIIRLDLNYAVGVVSQFMLIPQKPQFGCSETHIEVHKTYITV
jgi:hypothetical protein